MDKKLTIGLIYGRDKNWIAGSYYIENLIFAIDKQTRYVKPCIKIYTDREEDFTYLKALTSYPEMLLVLLKDNQNILDKIINKLTYYLFGKHFIVKGIDTDVDLLFPASNTFYFDKIKSKLFWIPDFQEKYFPHYFSKEEISKRDKNYKLISKKEFPLVLSSESALSDFNKFYSANRSKKFVLPFSVTLPAIKSINVEYLRNKYQIGTSYFICSNQFWAHKNHIVVLEAINELKNNSIPINVVFTGLLNDRRNPDYIKQINRTIKDYNLEGNINFLGFVDRGDQLALMKNSIAIIQPSKFEGWSTVVEDAKALNHPIFLSDINVHKEQLPGYLYFFDPNKNKDLAELMELGLNQKLKKPKIDYEERRTSFGEQFMSVIYGLV